MARVSGVLGWVRALDPGGDPLYLQIVRQIETSVEDGRLRPGDRLPPQRRLAEALGVDFTTITRAYGEARRRGLLDAVTGRGSFVSPKRETAGPPIDLGMNIPPPPLGIRLGEAIRSGIEEILARADPNLTMTYHTGPGSRADRTAGANWLRPVLPSVDAERVVVCAGAQAALVALLATLVPPAGGVLCEPLAYPGLITAARFGRLRLHPVATDADGLDAAALEEVARRTGARLVCLTPTIQNPTTATMPAARREAIVAVARRLDLTILEDDPYALLALGSTPAPLAEWAPERTWYVATLSKTLTPGLRTAHVVAPVGADIDPLLLALRAVTQMPPPLMTALATHWIWIGLARDILDGVRREAELRQALARDILPATAAAHPSGLHVWLPLPAGWDRHHLVDVVRRQGLAITAADAFSLHAPTPDAVRLSLGGVGERGRLADALRFIAQTIAKPPMDALAIV